MRPDVRYHAICGVFRRPGCPRRTTSGASSACPWRTTFVLQKSTFQPRKLRVSAAYYVCTTKVDFPATEAPGVPGVLHLYYKSRLSSHRSSGRPRRTTFVLQKSTFLPRKLRVSGAYYVCTTKVDFAATEAPGVRGVLHLYYKSRLSSHGSSGGVRGVLHLYYKTRFSSHGSPRRTTSVLRKSKKKRKNTTVLAPRPRENPQRGYVCMSKNAKTRRFWHRANAQTRRGVTFVCQKTQKHDGFGTAPTPKPAEGLRLFVKKGKNTMVLAPRQRRNPQRVDARTKKNAKNDGFSTATQRLPAEGCPRTERNVKKRWF